MTRTKGSKDKKPRKVREDKEEQLERARKNSPVAKRNLPLEGKDKEYNTKLINFMLDITPNESIDGKNVEKLKERFVFYLKKCEEWGMKPANMSAYYCMGIDKNQAREWIIHDKLNPERADFMKKVQNFCSMSRESMALDGKINPVLYIFQAKNYDGMRDQQEMVVTPRDPLGEEVDDKRLQNKYLDNAIDGEIIDVETTEK